MNDRLKFVGEIITPYKELSQCPSNISEDGPPCEIIVYDEYVNELFGLRKGAMITILYWLCEAAPKKPLLYGSFALRTPQRPNPIGVAVCKIVDIKDGKISLRGLDCLCGTKLIDIKPAIFKEKEL